MFWSQLRPQVCSFGPLVRIAEGLALDGNRLRCEASGIRGAGDLAGGGLNNLERVLLYCY